MTRAADGTTHSAPPWARAVGFRSVEKVEEPVEGQAGATFFFRVNGVPVFVKGANWINSDQFEPRVPDTRIAALLRAARSANFNMLRVWGGGMYETGGSADRTPDLPSAPHYPHLAAVSSD